MKKQSIFIVRELAMFLGDHFSLSVRFDIFSLIEQAIARAIVVHTFANMCNSSSRNI